MKLLLVVSVCLFVARSIPINKNSPYDMSALVPHESNRLPPLFYDSNWHEPTKSYLQPTKIQSDSYTWQFPEYPPFSKEFCQDNDESNEDYQFVNSNNPSDDKNITDYYNCPHGSIKWAVPRANTETSPDKLTSNEPESKLSFPVTFSRKQALKPGADSVWPKDFKSSLQNSSVFNLNGIDGVKGLILLSRTLNYYPTAQVYQYDKTASKWIKQEPKHTATSLSYEFKSSQEYLLDVGLLATLNTHRYSKVETGDFYVHISDSTANLCAISNGHEWSFDYAFQAEKQPAKVRIQEGYVIEKLTGKEIITVGTLNLALTPYFNEQERSIMFYFTAGTGKYCINEAARCSTFKIIDKKDGGCAAKHILDCLYESTCNSSVFHELIDKVLKAIPQNN